MPSGDELSDDYVASVLAKDAKDNSLKYSDMGLQAYLPSKTKSNIPKPNTRFLRNIIRETDSHNATLLAKENIEARNRLRNLRKDLSKRRRETWQDELSRSKDQGRDFEHRSSKRRRVTSRDSSRDRDPSPYSRSRQDQSREYREASKDNHISKRRRRRSADSESDHKQSRRSKRHGRRSRSPSSRHRHRHRHGGRERRPRSVSSSPHHHDHHHRPRRKQRSPSPVAEKRSKPPRQSCSPSDQDDDDDKKNNNGNRQESDSDPLADILGPLPPKKAPPKVRRGRGTFAGPSDMSSHFSSSYDPTTDVLPDESDPDEWDQALEALRDRQRWKQQGANRLRDAGFGDDEIKKWENSGQGVWGRGKVDDADAGDAEIENVQWAKKGEGREWDRGKVVDSDGTVDVKAAWIK